MVGILLDALLIPSQCAVTTGGKKSGGRCFARATVARLAHR
jgi:hypothetical protein